MENSIFGEMLMQMAPPPAPLSPAPTPSQCSELDLSVTLTPERATPPTRPHTHSRQVRFTVGPDPHSWGDPGNAGSLRYLRTSPGTPRTNQSPGTGEGAELNTTLALKTELQQLQEAMFDSQKAVQEKLQSSSTIQECVRSRISEGVNFRRSDHLYRSLVSVSLSHDEVITQALRDRPILLTPSTLSSKFHSPPLEAPDLLLFYQSHCVIKETPLLPGDRIPPPRPSPTPRPAHTTFHLHQKHRAWEA